MLSSPPSSPAAANVLTNRTNAPSTSTRQLSRRSSTKGKRVASELKEGRKKRAKVLIEEDQPNHQSDHSEESDFEEDSDWDDSLTTTGPIARRLPPVVPHPRALFRADRASRFNFAQVSTQSILQSFVSSNKSDVFKCTSSANTVGTDLTPPYACSFSHAAKKNGKPLLAVATEEGSVHILDTTRRLDWDSEPQRTTLNPHENGIFSVRWSPSDTLVATCSGDHTTRITRIEDEQTTHVLHGHSSTVKCIAWDLGHENLLATGGRDGTICIWDLRIASQASGADSEPIMEPVITILRAHEDAKSVGKPRPRGRKSVPAPKSVTNLLYPDSNPYSLISSGSADGLLRCWDLRQPASPTKKSKSTKQKTPPVTSTYDDPTTTYGSRRPRGIIGLAAGTGPTAGQLFALGADSRIHTYATSSLAHLPIGFTHDQLQASSFSVGFAASPCGRWLASGSTGVKGNCLLFNIEGASRPFCPSTPGILLQIQRGDICAVDWAHGTLATCADDGTIRVWRPDIDVYRDCQADPELQRWDWSWSVAA